MFLSMLQEISGEVGSIEVVDKHKMASNQEWASAHFARILKKLLEKMIHVVFLT